MALTEAEKKRRQRAHAKDNHSLCDPRTCAALIAAPPVLRPVPAEPVTSGNAEPTPSRGDDLVRALGEARPLSVAERICAEQAGQILDMIDVLERNTDSDGVTARIKRMAADGTVVYFVVPDVVKEIRQQRGTLRMMLNELRQQAITAAVLAGKATHPVGLPAPVDPDAHPLGDDDRGGEYGDLFAMGG